jgi:hypothetical protein
VAEVYLGGVFSSARGAHRRNILRSVAGADVKA